VAFGAGIALYFTADREPALPVALAAVIALCVAAFLLPRNKFFMALVLTAAVAAGFATGGP
jgi:competence protein ComEC